MFENAELGQCIDKATYKQKAPGVRADLLQAQRELAAAPLAVVVVVAGVGGAGRSETVNHLLKWIDARGVQIHALPPPSDEERERPALWRYWRLLPPHGRMGIFINAWDTGFMVDCAFGRIDQAQLDRVLDRDIFFERMLQRENTLLVKFWLHLSRKAQKKRFQKLEADPNERWRVTKEDWKLYRHYDAVRTVSEHMLRRTNLAEAPWTIVEATDQRYRHLTVAETFLAALRHRLDQARAAPPRPGPQPIRTQPPEVNVLNQLDLTQALKRKKYKRELAEAQAELNRLTRRLHQERRSMILVFEGPDAAGKGGTIRHLTQAMDARVYQVIAVAAPTDEERTHPYLWRFWRHLPRLGRVTIYDRSWYGRVLVERIEGFATPEEWQRAYEEINDFEEQLTDFGIILIKFWLQISPEEQLRRFQEREETPYKQYKITAEDWRNRERWDSYEAAACEMIEKTSTATAPWVLVEANDKRWARVKVLQTVIGRLRAAFEGGPP